MSEFILKETENRSVFINKLLEFNRDITGLSSPPVLGLLSVLSFGPRIAFLVLLPLFIINEIICSLIKFFFFKNRPNYESWTNWYEKIQASSFPSIHAARFGVFVGFTINQSPVFLYGFNLKFFILVLFFILVSYSRIILKKHYFIDVLVGAVLGVLIGYFSDIILFPINKMISFFL